MPEPDYYNKIMNDMNKLMDDSLSYSTNIDYDEFNDYLTMVLTGENIDNATPYEFAVNVIAHTAGKNLINNNMLDKEVITEYDNEITVACMQVLLSTDRDYTSWDEFVFSSSLIQSIHNPLNHYSMSYANYNVIHNVYSKNNLTINSVHNMSKKLVQALMLLIIMIILDNDNILSYLYSVDDAAVAVDIFHHSFIDNILIGNPEEFAIESLKAMIEN